MMSKRQVSSEEGKTKIDTKKAKDTSSQTRSPNRVSTRTRSAARAQNSQTSSKGESSKGSQEESSILVLNTCQDEAITEKNLPSSRSSSPVSQSVLSSPNCQRKSRRSQSDVEIWLGLPFNLSIPRSKPGTPELGLGKQEQAEVDDEVYSNVEYTDSELEVDLVEVVIDSSDVTNNKSPNTGNASSHKVNPSKSLTESIQKDGLNELNVDLVKPDVNAFPCDKPDYRYVSNILNGGDIPDGVNLSDGKSGMTGKQDTEQGETYCAKNTNGPLSDCETSDIDSVKKDIVSNEKSDTVKMFPLTETDQQSHPGLDRGYDLFDNDGAEGQQGTADTDSNDLRKMDSTLNIPGDDTDDKKHTKELGGDKKTKPKGSSRLRKLRQKEFVKIELEIEDKKVRVQQSLEGNDGNKSPCWTPKKSAKKSKSKYKLARNSAVQKSTSQAAEKSGDENPPQKRGRGRPRKVTSFPKKLKEKRIRIKTEKRTPPKNEYPGETPETQEPIKVTPDQTLDGFLSTTSDGSSGTRPKRARQSSRLNIQFPFLLSPWKQDRKSKRERIPTKKLEDSDFTSGDDIEFDTPEKTSKSSGVKKSSGSASAPKKSVSPTLDKKYSQQAFTLWASEARRHLMQKLGGSSTGLDSKLQDAWWKLSEAEKAPFYNRAKKALQDDPRTKRAMPKSAKRRPQSSEKGWSATTFKCLSESQQNSVLRRKMATLQRTLSKEMYTRLLTDFQLLRYLALEEEDKDVLFRVCFEAERKLEIIKNAISDDNYTTCQTEFGQGEKMGEVMNLPDVTNSHYQTQVLYEAWDVSELPLLTEQDVQSVLQSS